MTHPTVMLDNCELEMAAQVAAFRVKRVLMEELGRGHGESGVGFEDRHLPGALGEIALAKLLQLYWGGSMNDFGAFGDVGEYEVRGSWISRAHCIVYPGDLVSKKGPKDPLVVLVTIDFPAATIRGCVRASTALAVQEYRDIGDRFQRKGGTPGWWVPQSDLISL